MTSGIRFYSQIEASGYGLAGLGYVRALLHAGIRVQWVPLVYNGGPRLVRAEHGAVPPLMDSMGDDESLRDLPMLLAATSRPIDADTVLVHTTPENWVVGFEPGRRNVGFTTWEADRPPPHWMPSLNQADAICVPCEMNRAVFQAAHVRPPVHVVPHILKSRWNQFESAEVEGFREQLGIPANHYIFYSINRWDPRKNLPALLRAFATAFTVDDPVTLIVKTTDRGHEGPPYYRLTQTAGLIEPVTQVIEAELGRPLPPICVLPYELTGRGVDLLHVLGDCFVSLTHGEGWGLGAFDAASRGTPVIMTGWGGQVDFLGTAHRGHLPYRMVQVPIFPPDSPSLWPPQRWAEPDASAAIAAMRSALREPAAWQREAALLARSIQSRFDERAVSAALLAALRP